MTKIKPRKMMKIWKVRIIEVAFGVRGLIRRLMNHLIPTIHEDIQTINRRRVIIHKYN
jgi:hypothetical protein